LENGLVLISFDLQADRLESHSVLLGHLSSR